MGRHHSNYEDDNRSDYSMDRMSSYSGSSYSARSEPDTKKTSKAKKAKKPASSSAGPVNDPEKLKMEEEAETKAKSQTQKMATVIVGLMILAAVIGVAVYYLIPSESEVNLPPSMHTKGACVNPTKTQKQLDRYYNYRGHIGHYCKPTDELTLGLTPEIPRNDMGQPEFEVPKALAPSGFSIEKFGDHSFGCRSVVVYRPRLSYQNALEVCKYNGYQLLVLDSLLEACHLATDVQYIGTSKPSIGLRPTAFWIDSQISRKEPNGTIVWTTSKGRPLGGPIKPCSSLREKEGYHTLIGSDPHLYLDFRQGWDITHEMFGCTNIAYKRDYLKASFVCKRCGYRHCDGMCGLDYPSYPEQCNLPHLTFE